jgi:prepilin-type processing-associated H-X9-DG protein
VVSVASGPAAFAASAVDDLIRRMPDDVIAFMGAGGEDTMNADFAKTILGRIYHDPNVVSLCRSIETQIEAKIQQNAGDPNMGKQFAMATDAVQLISKCSLLLGVGALKGPVQFEEKSPVYGFAVLDAGGHKAEIQAMVEKLESLADAGRIADVNVGSNRMRGPGVLPSGSLYWGWSGDYFVVAAGDGEGLTLQYLQKPRTAVPAYLKKVPVAGDVIVAHADVRRITSLVDAAVRQAKDAKTADAIAAVIKELGLSGVGTITWRAGFTGANVAIGAYMEAPTPRTGLLAALQPIDPITVDMVDERAVTAAIANLDAAAVYDTILGAVKAASADAYADMEEEIASLESEIQVSIRKDLLESMAGPAIVYTLGAGATPETPFGGVVALVKLKDAQLFEKTMASLGRTAAARSKGELVVSSKKRDDGLTVHTWVVPKLSMIQIMPAWSVANGYAAFGTNPAAHDLVARRLASGDKSRKSIRDTAGFREVASRLPKGLLSLHYADSQTQYTQAMGTARQLWPMASMFAMQAGLTLPPAAPSLDSIIRDMRPSCEMCWAESDGLYVQYQGAGIEASLSSVAATSLGMGILMPALARVRQLSFRMTSGTNLVGVGKACLLYASDHDDKLPPDLQTLSTEADLPARCLESKLKPKDFAGPSYIYIPGQNILMNPQNVVAYDNPEFCVDGVNVLFLDGHVEFMKPESFRQAMKTTYTRLQRPLPAIRFRGDNPDEDTKPSAGGDVVATPAVDPLALHEAVRRSDLKEIRTLIDRGVQVDWEDNRRDTALTMALTTGQLEAASLLIERGADVNHEGGPWGTPLQIATRLGQTKMVEMLIAKGANVNAALPSGWTALLMAARFGHTEIARMLMDSGADLHARTREEMTPLLFSVLHKRPEIERLLIARGEKPDVFAECMRGNAEAVAMSLKQDPKQVNAKVGQFTLLHWAAYCNHLNVAKVLIENGADVNANWENTPALHWAVRKGKPEMIKLFCSHGADVNRKGLGGLTVLHYAATPEAVELLAEQGADMNARANDGITPLHHAASAMGHVGAMKLSLPEDADIDRKYPDSLHRQAAALQATTIQAMLAHGADVNARDGKGKTALDIAEETPYETVISVLREHGGKRGRELGPDARDAHAENN